MSFTGDDHGIDDVLGVDVVRRRVHRWWCEDLQRRSVAITGWPGLGAGENDTACSSCLPGGLPETDLPPRQE